MSWSDEARVERKETGVRDYLSEKGDGHVFERDLFPCMEDIFLEILHFVCVFAHGWRGSRIQATKVDFPGDTLHRGDTEIHHIQELPNSIGKTNLLDVVQIGGLTIEENERADLGIELVPHKGTPLIPENKM